ncbi:MAG TPA: DUF4864 domain-containing protein [Burkholderiales bacterium]|nr:DUF4864 domain-containing protein [Burkholderiales bacterium]
MLRSLTFALCLLGLAAASPAADVSSEDAAAIRAVISEQLDAFARDDGPRAFALATSGIRERFGSPEIFMDMVRTGYPVVYRPKSVEFEKPVVVDGEVIQPVRMTDADGESWIAFYPMQRQPDGRWRINGCQLERLRGQRA